MASVSAHREAFAAALSATSVRDPAQCLQSFEAALSLVRRGDEPGWSIEQGEVVVPLSAPAAEALEPALRALAPWRKGPFRFGALPLDAEWRADLKWARLVPLLPELCGRRVLDVGSGNGWYALAALGAGAREVRCVEPYALFRAQLHLVAALAGEARIAASAGRLEDLQEEALADVVLCMGVLYHAADPVAALRRLRERTAPGGTVVLETIVVPGEDPIAWHPPSLYAGARGFHTLPTRSCLEGWLRRAGYQSLRWSEPVATTPAEQRSTEWSTARSLADGISAEDPTRTIEGLPAPWRVIVVGR